MAKPSDRFVQRMLTIDPNYGSQQHQRDYVERYDETQRRQPCPKDHEHAGGCYSAATLDAVAQWQAKRKG